jgi:DNA (cytosine-5)-methyltransferase 1
VDTTEELPTVIAFCAGYGGIERGLDLAGIEHRVIAYVEIEAFAIANLVSKMEAGLLPPAPIYTDIKTFPSEIFRDCVDILTAGYPCQPFSAAGNRKGEDDPRHLWPHIRRHIEAIRPAQCFFENVEGHVSLGLSTVVSDLEEDGYLTTWGIFSAREVGAPHQRKRVYIMANRNGIRCHWWQLPNRTGERTVEIEAQQRPEQPLVRSEVKGCSGDCGKNVAYTCGKRLQGSCTSRDFKGEEPESNEQLTARCNTAHFGSWETEPRLGRVVDGCANRVDRIRMLGNGVVPQTAAKAYTTLTERT